MSEKPAAELRYSNKYTIWITVYVLILACYGHFALKFLK